MSHTDTFDREERLTGSFFGSVFFHLTLVAVIIAANVIHPHRNLMGDVHGGGMGEVAVSVVSHIPLPSRNTPPNPVANPTESAVPTPPPKAKPVPKVKAPEPKAIPIPTHETVVKKPPREEVPVRNTFREKQQDAPNQMYSTVGQAVSSPMYQIQGAGGIGIGTNMPLGAQFGWYANLIIQQVAKNWHTNDFSARTAPVAILTFTIHRDGSVPESSVRVTQSSGIGLLDLSAKRAVMDAAPFPVLPQQYAKNEAEVELRFELKR